MRIFDHLLDVSGRSSVAAFWSSLMMLVTGTVAAVWLIERHVDPAFLPQGMTNAQLGLAVAALGFLMLSVLAVRRLRDRNRSPAWWLVLVVAPVALEALSQTLRFNGGETWLIQSLSFFSLVLAIWALLELGCMPSAQGSRDARDRFVRPAAWHTGARAGPPAWLDDKVLRSNAGVCRLVVDASAANRGQTVRWPAGRASRDVLN